MKKTIMGMLFLGTCCAALAQNTQTTNTTNTTTNQNSTNTTTNQNGTSTQNNMPTDLNSANTTNTSTDNAILQSSGNYSAYGPAVNVSSSTQMAFTRDYPTATGVTWQQNNEWTRASYRTGARNMQVFYSANGSSYAVALPVVQGYVAEEVIGKALDTYGDRLYSITKLKSANGQDAYQLTLTQNGQTSTEWISEDGSAVMNVYRTNEENTDAMNNTGSGTTTTNGGNGPNAGDVMEGEDLYYNSMSPDDDYTTNYEEQTEWTTTAADTATNADNGTNKNEEDNTTVSANGEAVMNNEEE
jgi:hypothetical protein